MASNLLLCDAMSDVVLKVRHEGYSWRYPAHSLMLVNKSSTFQDMLEERSGDDNTTPISFIDVMKPETGLAVLKHIYKDDYPDDVTADLLIAAQKYNLPSLRDNLEERFMSDMSIVQACQMAEELQQRQPAKIDCAIKCACLELLETHALTVFGSDLVMLLGKPILTLLLQSSSLNIPDDAYAFWSIWRWGKRQCSKNNRSLTDQNVASSIDDLIVLIRNCNVKNRIALPPDVPCRFNRCKGPRNRYSCPVDILIQSSSLRPCPTWEDIIQPKLQSEGAILCLQLSFDKDVLLVGMTFEACLKESNCNYKRESILSLMHEADCRELRRQKVCWCQTELRRTSIRSDPECRLETELTLLEPIFLTKGTIYSLYLYGNFNNYFFPWAAISKRRLRVGDTFVNLHGDGVTTIREIYLMPDMSITWGHREPPI